MKKLFKYLLLSVALLLLVACGNGGADSAKESQKEVAGTVQLIVRREDDVTDEKVDFYKGDTVMDVLKENYEVEESNGFITVIDGLAQDEEAGKYWMFDLNDDLAPKAADQIKVQDGDKIEFYQETFNS